MRATPAASAWAVCIALCGCRDGGKPVTPPPPPPPPAETEKPTLRFEAAGWIAEWQDPTWVAVGAAWNGVIVWVRTDDGLLGATSTLDDFVSLKARGAFRCQFPVGLHLDPGCFVIESSDEGALVFSAWVDVITVGR